MSYFSSVRTGNDIAAFLRQRNARVTSIGETLDGLPILAVRLGGSKKPSVLIKAGSHASEIGAIHGALTLVDKGVESDHEIWLLPCTCPFDFAGYSRALSFASGERRVINDDFECRRVLSESGRLLHDEGAYAAFRIGEMIFLFVDQRVCDPRSLAYGQLERRVRGDARLQHEYGGRRIFLPNSVYYPEDFNSYEHAALTCWANWDGWIGNMNRFYDHYDPPPEVRCVRLFCEELQPAFVLDLHECGEMRNLQERDRSAAGAALSEKHYLILPPVHGPRFEAMETRLAEGILEATAGAGLESHSADVLRAAWGFGDSEYFDGYIRCDQRPVMGFYQWGMRYESSIVVETGMNQPVESRARIHVEAVRGALQAFSRLY